MKSLLPWHELAWAQLQQRRQAKALPHAWLFSGPAGGGKAQFALGVARALLCSQPDSGGWGCGHCSSCQWVMQGSHPALVWAKPEEDDKVSPDKASPTESAHPASPTERVRTGGEASQDPKKKTSQSIHIDAVRALSDTLVRTSNRYKLAIIHPAEWLTAAAANSLLKILEEPPPNCLLLLVSNWPTKLPATVRSRCIHLHLALPTQEQSLTWLTAAVLAVPVVPAPDAAVLLALSGGAPLRALTLAENAPWLAQRPVLWQQMHRARTGASDPLVVAAAWNQLPLALALEWLQRGMLDLLRLRLAGSATPLANPDISRELQALVPLVSVAWLADYLADLQRARLWAQTALTSLLLLEELLLAWRHSGRLAEFKPRVFA